MKISYMWAMSLLLTGIFLLLVQATQKKSEKSKEAWSQFECGFNSMNPPHMPFSFQFFMVSILFLIFDIEIALVLSFPMEPQTTKNVTMILMFLITLTIGLTYEWQKSKIKWSE
uniref:NADH-ubiquinone oxidoreductase chain 3 n=1 Tax=Oribatula sp. XFX TaxID=2652662 RepID=A0A5J6VBU5_9ACAR|nr:NADH dehydrogenase subunit 3 [Oribatula sp. XFX]